MIYPTIAEYNQTIKNKGGKAFKTLYNLSFIAAKNFPIKIFSFGSGSYAVIFKATDNNSHFAIRCFLTAENEAINRNKIISDYLKKVTGDWKVNNDFFENEIEINGKLFPVLKMEWVEGVLINQFISSNLSDNFTLSLIQKQLVDISDNLEQNKIGHGDLQCGNIIVKGTPTDFVIKLIDYDGMFVPSLDSKNSLERGRSEFQHPNRSLDYFNCYVDRFSFWVMLTALEAIKFDNSLWKEVMQGGFNTLDNFLFTTNDFIDTNQSKLFNRLLQINSESLNFYTERLIRFSNNDITQVDKPKLFEPSNIKTEKITINSNVNNAFVLTSMLKRIGIVPLELDKQSYEGKTLLISNGIETKQVIISKNTTTVEIIF